MFNSINYPIRTLIGVLAFGLSILASYILIYRATLHASVSHLTSFMIYSIGLIAVWGTSTLYHTLNVSERTRDFLEHLDHAMIYFLIAATYTPMCLVVLRGGWGWSLFGINWALALVGIILKLTIRQSSNRTVVLLFALYLIMGWLVVIAWIPLSRALPHNGLILLVFGGIFYTIGAMIYRLKLLEFSDYFGSHEIWHLFVGAGCFCHYWMMLKYVLYMP